MAQLMVGAIIHILEDVYRLIYVQPDACVLCRMNTTKLILNYFETAELTASSSTGSCGPAIEQLIISQLLLIQ